MGSLLIGAAVGIALIASGRAAGKPPATRVIHTKDMIESFAIGGQRIAYDLRGTVGCNRVLLLNLRTNRTTRVSGRQTCPADSTSTGAGVRELAIAGSRLAWIVNQGGNTESDDYLYTVSLPRPRERRLASARRFGDVGGILAGTWIANLVASGDLLAVNRWTTDESGSVTRSGVDAIVGSRLRRLATSRKAILAQSADAGRIAVLYGDGTIVVYGRSGRLQRRVQSGPATEIALSGETLVVLTEARTLETYSTKTGAHLRSRPLPARAPGELDASGGVAIYVAHPQYTLQSFKVHAVRLRTGKDVVVASGNWQLRQSAELEPAGLLYARDRHNLVLLPFRQVAAATS